MQEIAQILANYHGKNLVRKCHNTRIGGDEPSERIINGTPQNANCAVIQAAIPETAKSDHRHGDPDAAVSPGAHLEEPAAAAGTTASEAPLTLAEHQEEARWICSMLPAGDADRLELESFIEIAGRGDEDDMTRLGILLVEVYARRIDREYRAAIWGGRTWNEVRRGKDRKEAPR